MLKFDFPRLDVVDRGARKWQNIQNKLKETCYASQEREAQGKLPSISIELKGFRNVVNHLTHTTKSAFD